LYNWLRVDILHETQFDPVFASAVALRGGSLSPDIYTDLDEIGGQLPEFKRDESRRLFVEPLTNIAAFLEWLGREAPAASPLLSSIKAGYVCNPDHHAYVERAGEHYIIGVYTGLVDMLTQAAFALFASSDAFPGIGHPSQEVRHHFIKSLDPEDAVDVREFVSRGFSKDAALVFGADWRSLYEGHILADWPRPFDFKRLEAAHLAVSCAVEFAFLHELGHLLCGHFSLGVAGSALVDGAPVASDSALTRDTLHFMEVDADSMAVQLAAGGGLIAPLAWKRTAYDNGFRDSAHIPAERRDSGLAQPDAGYFDRNTLSYLWAVGINLLLCIFSQGDVRLGDWKSPDHPHPLFRALNIIPTVSSCRVEGDTLSEILPGQSASAFWDVIHAWNSHHIPGGRMLAFETEDIEALTDSMNAFYGRIGGIYGEMEKGNVRIIGNHVCRRLLKRASGRSQGAS